jgi:hypothetical protein
MGLLLYIILGGQRSGERTLRSVHYDPQPTKKQRPTTPNSLRTQHKFHIFPPSHSRKHLME